MPGSGYSPLTIKVGPDETPEIDLFRSAARESRPLEELIALVGIDTGLRCTGIAHMTEDWLDRSGADLSIDVPQTQRCRLGTENSGKGGDTTQRSVPCYNCKHRNMDKEWVRAKHRLPDGGDCWRAKSEAGYKGREIPILEDDTERVVENYFKVHDLVAGRRSVRNAVIRVAKRAGIHETSTEEMDNGDEITHHWPTTHDLRDTFGTRLALKGFGPHEIKSLMGHSSIEQATDYIELSGAATVQSMKEKWKSE